MEGEAAAIDRLLDKAIEKGIPVDWVQKTINLICFLRTAQPTINCLYLLQRCRTKPYTELFGHQTDQTDETPVEQRILKLARRHKELEEGTLLI